MNINDQWRRKRDDRKETKRNERENENEKRKGGEEEKTKWSMSETSSFIMMTSITSAEKKIHLSNRHSHQHEKSSRLFFCFLFSIENEYPTIEWHIFHSLPLQTNIHWLIVNFRLLIIVNVTMMMMMTKKRVIWWNSIIFNRFFH